MLTALVSAMLAMTWCQSLGSTLAEPWPDDNAQRLAMIERALSALPVESQPVAGQIRGLLGKDAALDDARAALTAVSGHGCAQPPAHAGAPAAEVKRLVAMDPRFGGVRVGDDVVDRIMARFWRWLSSFLESQGMQRYAGSARVIYLAGLAFAVLFVVVRLARAWRNARFDDDNAAAADARARVEMSRQRAARDLAGEAHRVLESDPHRAAALFRAALLARVGEQRPGTVTPARTSREVLARLDASRQLLLEPPLALFDSIYFAKPTTPEDARAFGAAVERASQTLSALPGAAGAAGAAP